MVKGPEIKESLTSIIVLGVLARMAGRATSTGLCMSVDSVSVSQRQSALHYILQQDREREEPLGGRSLE